MKFFMLFMMRSNLTLPTSTGKGSPAARAGRCRGGWWLIILASLTLLCTVPTLALAAADPIEPAALQKKYEMARSYFQNLKAKSPASERRENWEENIRTFRQIYLAAPKDELGSKSLFMMGRIYQELYGRFHSPPDLDEAISYYTDVTVMFPASNLADDALFSLGRLYLDGKQDRKLAADTFNRIASQYPQGDMASQAIAELKALGREVGPAASAPAALEPAAITPPPPPPEQAQQTAQPIDHSPAAVAAPDATQESLAAAQAPSQGSNGRVQVLPVKYWSTDNYTRVVVQTTGPVKFKHQLLEKEGNQPRRLYIDLANSRIALSSCNPVEIQDGLLKRVRAAQFTSDTVRVVLDIESITSYKIFSLEDPFRAIIDVMGNGQAQAQTQPAQPARPPGSPPAAAIAPPAPAPSPKAGARAPAVDPSRPSLAKQLGLGVRKIVIDPGHGGKDPGAIAANGLMEKDVVLVVARKLVEHLRQRLSCEVILTRDRDVFIPLEERTAIANTRRGDIFVSVHLNSAPSPKVQGVETYVLNLTNNQDAMRLAAFENATSTSKMSDLQNILADILKNTKLDESTRLAEHVQTNMVRGLKLKDLGVKQAPFFVLIGAQMPAILSEITFISDPQEAKRLRDTAYLAAIAKQISAGIFEYVSSANLAMAKGF